MTRKEFEEIKDCVEHYTCESNNYIYSGLEVILLAKSEQLIHAIENGGIEDEPGEDDEPELLPCPFCNVGTEALIFKTKDDGKYNDQGQYMCSKNNGGCGASSGYCPSCNDETVKQRAADKWNTRATTPTEPIIMSKNLKDAISRVIGKNIVASVDWKQVGEDVGVLIKLED